jgi:hypothetical protein
MRKGKQLCCNSDGFPYTGGCHCTDVLIITDSHNSTNGFNLLKEAG